MQAFKKYSTAKAKANGKPIVKIGELYIIGINSSTQCQLIDTKIDIHSGHIGMKHLNRLGNANWATTNDKEFSHGSKLFN